MTKAKKIILDEQVTLQLGCVGSKSKINFGTKVPVHIGTVAEDVYFDIVNLDRYDCVIGTPFMNKHGVCLNFGKRTIKVGREEIRGYTIAEEIDFIRRREPRPKPWIKRSTNVPIAEPTPTSI